jgi:hypothetical protein
MTKVPNWVLVAGLLAAGCEAPVTGWGDYGDGGAYAQHVSSSSGSGGSTPDSGAATGGDAASTGSSSGSSSGAAGSSGGSSGSSSGAGSSSSSSGSSSGGATGGGDGGIVVTCTSGVTSHADEGSSMKPGDTCVTCHSSGNSEANPLTIGGTVYPTLHEPTDCDGVSVTGATVVITDANSKVQTLTVNSVGNFLSSTAVATPYTASVVYNGTTLSMITPQTSGDCNSCHTVTGANGAPGRIMLP